MKKLILKQNIILIPVIFLFGDTGLENEWLLLVDNLVNHGTLAFGLTLTDHQPRENIEKNFQMMATLLLGALGRLGVEAKIGPVTGEYCPGKFSINSQGKFKLAGIGQRLARNATYIGGVISYQQNLIAEEILALGYSTLNLELEMM